MAKTTKDEIVYHRGGAVKVSTAMRDTMEAEYWAPELRVCSQPPGELPSDTRLHRLQVALLDLRVQVNAPLHGVHVIVCGVSACGALRPAGHPFPHGVVLCRVVLCCALLCRRRCYHKAMVGMSTHGFR